MAKRKDPLAFAFVPIDWAAIAIRDQRHSRRTRKGDKRPACEIEAMLAARRENRRRRQRAKLAARPKRPHNHPASNRPAILMAMEPGCWYGQPDIEALTGIHRDRLTVTLLRMRQAGFLERAKNPEWRSHTYRKGVPVDRQAARDPEFLWHMTGRGEAERRWQLALR